MGRKEYPLLRSSLLQCRIPICDECEGTEPFGEIGFHHQKALAIGCHFKEVKGPSIDLHPIVGRA